MGFDAGEFRDWVTVLATTGELRDELNQLTGNVVRPLYSWFARVQDATGTDSAIADAKPEQRTYTVKMPVHPDYPASSHHAFAWDKLTMQVVSYRLLGDLRDVVQYTCSHTEGL